MQLISVCNVNQAWDEARKILNHEHTVRPSRVGEVCEHPEPVTTQYTRPLERVLFNVERNGNCFFHFFEAMWMLAGRQDLAFLETYNAKISEYVGKDPLIHDAYGYRWRFAFDLDGGAEDGYADQLPKIARMLKKSPDERRAVLCMWNPIWDLERPELPSVPCNTQVYFKIRNGCLTMTVMCRSNDIVLGCYGANVVHFSFLQEYMAAMIGVPVGPYWQVSDSWHAYTSRWEELGGKSNKPTYDYYSQEGVKPYPLVADPETFDDELKSWMEERGDALFYKNPFFIEVADPLKYSWEAYKQGDLKDAKRLASRCKAEDWRIAATQWLERVEKKRLAKTEKAGRV